MAETTPLATGTTPEATPAPVVQTPTPPAAPAAEVKDTGDLNIAIHQTRQELGATKDQLAAKEAELATTKAQLEAFEKEKKEKALETLPGDERLEREMQEFSTSKVITTVSAELAKMPAGMRTRVENNPFGLVDPREAQTIEATATSRNDFWRKMESAAIASVREATVGMEAAPAAPAAPDAPVVPAPPETPPANPDENRAENEVHMTFAETVKLHHENPEEARRLAGIK